MARETIGVVISVVSLVSVIKASTPAAQGNLPVNTMSSGFFF